MKLSSRSLRWLVLVLAATFAIGCSSSGNGNGDDDNGGDDDNVALLPLYNFQLTSATDDPLTVSLPGLEGALVLRLGHLFEGPGVFGSYHPASRAFSIALGSSLVIDELGKVPVLYGDFTVEATSDWFVPADSYPETGAMIVGRGDESIEVAVIEGGTTVRLRWDELGDGEFEATELFTWPQFDDLLDAEEAPEWQLLGAFGYSATVDFLLELAEIGIQGLEAIDDDLETSGGLEDKACDAFSAAGLSVPNPPPVIPDLGWLTLEWLDDASDGNVGPGDSFVMAFDYCMSNDSDDNIKDMLNGTLGLNSYTEVLTLREGTNFITRIGFEGMSPAARAGGLEFDAFERWEVYDIDGSGPGTTTEAELNVVINGRLELVFFEP